MLPIPTFTSSATLVWDSNSLDLAQVIEIAEIPTTFSAGLPAAGNARTKIERRSSRLWKNLGCCAAIGWVFGTEFAAGC